MPAVSFMPTRVWESGELTRCRDATVEETVQALETLEKSYRDASEKICRQHIGVYIKQISDRLPLGHRHILDVRRLVYSTMGFVLDQIKGQDVKLDELDQDELTPLHVAIATMMPDCVELLLARGANLNNEAGWTSPRNYYEVVKNAEIEDSVQIDGIFQLYQGLTHGLDRPSTPSPKHISVTWYDASLEIDNQKFDTVDARLGGMFDYGPWKTGTHSDADLEAKNIWFHVPCTSVSRHIVFNGIY